MNDKRPHGRTREPAAVDRVRSRRPEDESWRADALGRSRHSRMVDELRLPAHDSDPARARLLCATVCRDLLGDLSPSLVFLAPRDRRRAQALIAYLRALFDFALQPGLDGERLARINRWQFELDRALEGGHPGQPVFVAMSLEHLDRPWSPTALDTFTAVARRWALTGFSSGVLQPLAAGVCEALAGLPSRPEVTDLAARLFLVLGRRQLALAERPEEARQEGSTDGPPLDHPFLEARLDEPALRRIPRRWRCFLRFLAAVADDFQPASGSVPKALGLGDRIRLLLRSLLQG